MTTIDRTKMEAAKEWAEDVSKIDPPPTTADLDAAAEIIQSLSDRWIDADKLREFVASWEERPVTSDADLVLRGLKALMPAPAPRTLADMTIEEREACQWMQATVMDEEDVMTGVIQRVHPHGIWVMFKSGRRNDYRPEEVVPRPDLPRLVWPDEHHPADAEETQEPEQPRPEDVPEGEAWIVEFDGQQCAAERELPGTEKPWWLMIGWRVSDSDITLVSRLVPEEQA